MTSDAGQTAPTVIQWALDTRELWPKAIKTSDLAKEASRALALLPEEDQAQVLRYYFVKDAKMALASRLLKRLAITRYCPSVSWSAAIPTRDKRTKPVFLLPDGSEPVLFNVTHQAGIVLLLGVANPRHGTAVGVDIVCQPERREKDHKMIRDDGWPKYVDVHADVLSKPEVTSLKHLPWRANDAADVDRLLGYFYALWCLREAYVKMTGDALLASWLGELEMRYFAPPGELAPEGEALEVWFKGRQVDDLDIRLEPLLDGYAVSTVVREGKKDGVAAGELKIGEFENLNIEQVLDSAEEAMKRR